MQCRPSSTAVPSETTEMDKLTDSFSKAQWVYELLIQDKTIAKGLTNKPPTNASDWAKKMTVGSNSRMFVPRNSPALSGFSLKISEESIQLFSHHQSNRLDSTQFPPQWTTKPPFYPFSKNAILETISLGFLPLALFEGHHSLVSVGSMEGFILEGLSDHAPCPATHPSFGFSFAKNVSQVAFHDADLIGTWHITQFTPLDEAKGLEGRPIEKKLNFFKKTTKENLLAYLNRQLTLKAALTEKEIDRKRSLYQPQWILVALMQYVLENDSFESLSPTLSANYSPRISEVLLDVIKKSVPLPASPGTVDPEAFYKNVRVMIQLAVSKTHAQWSFQAQGAPSPVVLGPPWNFKQFFRVLNENDNNKTRFKKRWLSNEYDQNRRVIGLSHELACKSIGKNVPCVGFAEEDGVLYKGNTQANEGLFLLLERTSMDEPSLLK